MIKFIPYFEQGFTLDEIKEKFDLSRSEDYSNFPKGIKYLHVNQFQKDDNLQINNHPIKYVVSATLRVVKHLHTLYGNFDEIRVESTRELSLNDESKKAIDKSNKDIEKQIKKILENKEYQEIANNHNKNLSKYARKILMWQEQEEIDIYTGQNIGLEDIFSNSVDIDHIVPQSLGGLSVKHNLVLVHRNSNLQKSNQLPLNFVSNKDEFINRVEYLFENHKINWKKKINLLAVNLDEVYKDTFESKSLRATSYIEALTAQILKRYYPFNNKTKQKDGSAVRHIQGRATANIRKVLQVKTKTRDTNIHHAIDAILIGFVNHSWLQKLSNTFRENFGTDSYEEAMKNIKKIIPTIEIVLNDEVKYLEPKDLVELIENNYNFYGEDSIFYKDIWDNTKTVNFWVSKKPMSSKIHKDTIYSKKENGIYTVREDITKAFIGLDIKITEKKITTSQEFIKVFQKSILNKMYLYKTNPNDIICKIVQNRANEIKELLESFENIDKKDKEQLSQAKKMVEELIHKNLIDNNGNIIRKVKFYQTNLTGFDIKKGLATKEKSFIGFQAVSNNGKLEYKRIDMSNYQEIKKSNSDSFKVYKNDLVFFIFADSSYKCGKIVSFLEDKKMSAFSNPKFPAAYKFQPNSFCKDKAHTGAKQHVVNSAIGIINLNLDILGNIESYSKIGYCQSQLLDNIKNYIKR
jgi:CRISPR-associated endonuclease Csn1